MEAKYSEYDSKGKLFIDCSECERGGNGNDKDKCSCGWKVKKGGKGGCFIGELINGLIVAKQGVMMMSDIKTIGQVHKLLIKLHSTPTCVDDVPSELYDSTRLLLEELEKVKQESLRKPKDHEIADFVNGLVAVSHQYEGTQQLRTHVSKEVQAFLNKIGDDDDT